MQQLKVVRSLIRDCTATYFTLTLDPLTDGSEEVFATSQQTYKILKEYAKRDGVDIKAPIKLTDLHRFKMITLLCLNRIFSDRTLNRLKLFPKISVFIMPLICMTSANMLPVKSSTLL